MFRYCVSRSKLMNPRRSSGVVALMCIILLSCLSVIALAMASEVGLQLRITRNIVDAHQAMLNARSGLEWSVYTSIETPGWRSDSDGATFTKSFSGGSFTIEVADEDGDLQDCPIDPVIVTSQGRVGTAIKTLEAIGEKQPHPAVRYVCAATTQGLKIGKGTVLRGDARSNHNIKKGAPPLPEVRGDLIVSDRSIDDKFADEDTKLLSAEFDLASPPKAALWYRDNGTCITPDRDGNRYVLRHCVLSPTTNPYGTTDAEGIYWFDATNEGVILQSVRLIGTLVVLNAKKVIVRDSAWQEPARPAPHQTPAPTDTNGKKFLWLYPGIEGWTNGHMRQDRTYTTGRTDPPDEDPDADSIAGTTIHNHNDTTRGDLGDYWRTRVYLPQSTDWYAWGRYYSPALNLNPDDPGSNSAPNSFRLSVTGGVIRATFCNNEEDADGRFAWRRWLWAGDNIMHGDPEPLPLGYLTRGVHTLSIYDRANDGLEGGGVNSARLDSILLTTDPAYRPVDEDAPWIEGSISQEDGAGHCYPYVTLLVAGEIRYELTGSMNENLTGVDYDQDGVIAGSHPNTVRGVVCATQKIEIVNDTEAGATDFLGCMVSDRVTIESVGGVFRHDRQLAENPIVGFCSDGFSLVPGTIREVRE